MGRIQMVQKKIDPVDAVYRGIGIAQGFNVGSKLEAMDASIFAKNANKQIEETSSSFKQPEIGDSAKAESQSNYSKWAVPSEEDQTQSIAPQTQKGDHLLDDYAKQVQKNRAEEGDWRAKNQNEVDRLQQQLDDYEKQKGNTPEEDTAIARQKATLKAAIRAKQPWYKAIFT